MQFPESTQGFNRYTYVGNNPLSATDPSGYFSLKDAVKTVVGVVASVYLSPVLTGAIMGYMSTGTVKGAFLGMMAGAIAYNIGAGAELGTFGTGATQAFSKALLHGVTQGALSKAGGGRFGDGFIGGASGSFAGNIGLSKNPIVGTIQAAIVGGTLAKIGGGKFANGAVSAAIVHSLNHARHSEQPGRSNASEEDSQLDAAGEPKPPGDYVIGPTGYWQRPKGAMEELFSGPYAQATDLPLPQNAPSCVATCTTIGVLESLATGSATASQFTVAADKTIDVTKESATLLEASPRPIQRVIGKTLSKYIIPLRILNVGIEYPWIKTYCEVECNAPVEF